MDGLSPPRSAQFAIAGVAARLCDLALTLRVMPTIRYAATSAATSAAQEAASALAQLRDGIAAHSVRWAWNTVEALARGDADSGPVDADAIGISFKPSGATGGGLLGGAATDPFRSGGGGSSGSTPLDATFVIVDRSFDLVTPLLTDFGVYALALDSLPCPSPAATRFRLVEQASPALGASTSSVTPAPPGVAGERDDFVFDARDTLTKELRGVHIARAGALLEERRTAFVSRNAAAAAVVQFGDVKHASKEDLGKVAASLPQYLEVKQKIADHLLLIKALTNAYTSRHLVDISRLEQRFVTGCEPQGDPVAAESLVLQAERMLRDVPALARSEAARLRLVGLATASVTAWGSAVKDDALRAALVKRIVLAADSPRAQDVSTAITRMQGVKSDENAQTGGAFAWLRGRRDAGTAKRPAGTAALAERTLKAGRDKAEGCLLDANGKPFDTARFVPSVRYIIEDTLSKSLPSRDFGETAPVADIAAVTTTAAAPEAAIGTSLRARGRANSGAGIVRMGKPQVVVIYVMGGASAAEMREASNACNPNTFVMVCGDELLSPDVMVSNLVRTVSA